MTLRTSYLLDIFDKIPHLSTLRALIRTELPNTTGVDEGELCAEWDAISDKCDHLVAEIQPSHKPLKNLLLTLSKLATFPF